MPSSPSFRSKSNVIKTGDEHNLSKIATYFQASSVSPWPPPPWPPVFPWSPHHGHLVPWSPHHGHLIPWSPNPMVTSVPVVAITLDTRTLAEDALRRVGLPPKTAIDAVDIATAAQKEMDYWLTWNCKHIANPSFRRKIEEVLSDHGLASPVICTPQELINV